MNIKANEIIDALGGTSAVAKMANCSIPAICKWRRHGIPNMRYQLLLFTHKKQMKLIADHHLSVSMR
jgi:hypothetical protein